MPVLFLNTRMLRELRRAVITVILLCVITSLIRIKSECPNGYRIFSTEVPVAATSQQRERVMNTTTDTAASDEFAIWCVESLSQKDVQNDSQSSVILHAPPTSLAQGDRIPYRYSSWKSSHALPRNLVPCEHVLVMRLLTYIKNICRDHNITFLITNGTLLGSWRHHDIIPWDDDADIIMKLEDQPRFIETVRKSYSSVLQHILLPFSRRPERSFKLFFRNTPCVTICDWKFPAIDVITYASNSTHLWFADEPRIILPLNFIFPIIMRPLAYLWLPAPRFPEKLLPSNIDKECRTTWYNHRTEKLATERGNDCAKLHDVYPFVVRNSSDRSIEMLSMNGNLLHTIVFSVAVN